MEVLAFSVSWHSKSYIANALGWFSFLENGCPWIFALFQMCFFLGIKRIIKIDWNGKHCSNLFLIYSTVCYNLKVIELSSSAHTVLLAIFLTGVEFSINCQKTNKVTYSLAYGRNCLGKMALQIPSLGSPMVHNSAVKYRVIVWLGTPMIMLLRILLR